MADFNEQLKKAQRALDTQLAQGAAADPSLVTGLFYSGYARGLSDKEIIAALLKPLAGQVLARR